MLVVVVVVNTLKIVFTLSGHSECLLTTTADDHIRSTHCLKRKRASVIAKNASKSSDVMHTLNTTAENSKTS